MIPVVKIIELFARCKKNLVIGGKLLISPCISVKWIRYHASKIYSSAAITPVKMQTPKFRLRAESAMIMKYRNTGGKYSA
jgi:hypothetical protein